MNTQRLLVALGLALLALCPGCGDDDESLSGMGACAVAGDGIVDSCYADYEASLCGASVHTFHTHNSCPQAGFPVACCDGDTEGPLYYRPSGASCDANDWVCGQPPPNESDRCSRCLDSCCNGCDCGCEAWCL